MLVLSRKQGEGFYVGNAYIKVLPGTTLGTTRLGIDAPPSIRIMREELLEGDSGDPSPANRPVVPGPWSKIKRKRRAA